MALESGREQHVYGGQEVLEERQSMGLDSLKVLEGRVEGILTRHAGVVAERDRLQQELREAQERIAQLSARLEAVEEERGQIRARVESILGRLEGLDLG